MSRRGRVAPRLMLGVATWWCLLLAGDVWAAPVAASAPAGEMRWALYVTISPAWFDRGRVAVVGGTPFWFGYALYDALVKPMPDNPMAPSLAKSWTVSDDQRAYGFTLREGLTFRNGDPFTADFALPIEPYPYDPARAERLLAEAGYPNGFDAGDLPPIPPISRWGRRSPIIWGPSESR